MEVMTGRASMQLAPEALTALRQRYSRMLVDVGCGDGAFPYRVARAHADLLCVGLDPNRERMAEYARRARRKPARGGLENVLYVPAGIEALPADLAHVADLITLNFPWAGLLERLLTGELRLFESLRGLARDPCYLHMLINTDAPPPGLPAITLDGVRDALAPPLAAVGAVLVEVALLPPDARVPSEWGGRLIRGSGRRTLRVRAAFGSCPPEYAALLEAAG